MIGIEETIQTLSNEEKLTLIEKLVQSMKVDTTETEAIMRLAETGGSFDFLDDEEENIYSLSDLKVRYR